MPLSPNGVRLPVLYGLLAAAGLAIDGLVALPLCRQGHCASASVIATLPGCVRTLRWREDRVRPRLAKLASYISRVQCDM